MQLKLISGIGVILGPFKVVYERGEYFSLDCFCIGWILRPPYKQNLNL